MVGLFFARLSSSHFHLVDTGIMIWKIWAVSSLWSLHRICHRYDSITWVPWGIISILFGLLHGHIIKERARGIGLRCYSIIFWRLHYTCLAIWQTWLKLAHWLCSYMIGLISGLLLQNSLLKLTTKICAFSVVWWFGLHGPTQDLLFSLKLFIMGSISIQFKNHILTGKLKATLTSSNITSKTSFTNHVVPSLNASLSSTSTGGINSQRVSGKCPKAVSTSFTMLKKTLINFSKLKRRRRQIDCLYLSLILLQNINIIIKI